MLSSYFWDYTGAPYDPFVKAVIDSLAANKVAGYGKDSHYFFMLGNTNQANEIKIPFFENEIEALFDQHADVEFKDLGDLLKKIKSHYRYIYLPAEADSLSFSRMESIYIKKLLDEDIKAKIQESISRSSIDEINKKLKEFIDQINNTLDQYVYKGKYKDQLTAKILSKEYSLRILE